MTSHGSVVAKNEEKGGSEFQNFWRLQAERIHWHKPFASVGTWSFRRPVFIRWYEGGKTNLAYNCVDRHLSQRADQVAYFWEPDQLSNEPTRSYRATFGDPPGASRYRSALHITYRDLDEQVQALASTLKSWGVQSGDRVTIYLPMIPEAVFAMLACVRIGAVHSVVFAGFSADSLAGRIQDSASKVVITADFGVRGGKESALKSNVDQALGVCPTVERVLVVKRTESSCSFSPGRDVWYHEAVVPGTKAEVEWVDSEHPSFILYTSGSTGKPKGVLHTSGGYLVYAAWSYQEVFAGSSSKDVYWCTADVGWITGHSYVVYGPLANGMTSVIFEGVPHFPTVSRSWEIVEKYKATIFYTAPTLVRALMKEGESHVAPYEMKSLRLLGSVGEPINPEAWRWYQKVVGKGRCPIVDTWWQTETGGILISPRSTDKIEDQKPGSASRPLPMIDVAVVDSSGQALQDTNDVEGHLCLRQSWPGQARTLFNQHELFEQTYFSTHPGYYFSGDGCRRDRDGSYWLTGRVDDVINVAGHRLSTAELESCLVGHPSVAEAAVVGAPHEIKGQGIAAYVTLRSGFVPTPDLNRELIKWVRTHISPIATPEWILFSSSLPKTRSGKIMRRILRKIAAGEHDALGDVSTLADPGVVVELVSGYKEYVQKS